VHPSENKKCPTSQKVARSRASSRAFKQVLKVLPWKALGLLSGVIIRDTRIIPLTNTLREIRTKLLRGNSRATYKNLDHHPRDSPASSKTPPRPRLPPLSPSRPSQPQADRTGALENRQRTCTFNVCDNPRCGNRAQ
jgi:hypothetical protein